MLDDLRQFAADVHTISADFHRWAGQLWWLAALGLLVGLLNTALLGYLVWTVRTQSARLGASVNMIASEAYDLGERRAGADR